jgi:pimeloyl-ACP methyl ester carboxylesterase
MPNVSLMFVPAVVCAVSMLAQAGEATPAAPATPIPHVEQRGTGPVPMVLVPGLTCDWKVWDAFMERNKDKYTMYAVTLPGFGGTEPPATPETATGTPWLDNALAGIAATIDQKKLDKPLVVGHSLGGLLAIRMAIEHPGKVRGVVAVDGMPAFPIDEKPVPPAERVARVERQIGPSMLNTSDEVWSEQINMMAAMMVRDQERGQQLLEMFKTTPTPVGARYMVELMKTDVTQAMIDATTPMLVIAAVNNDNAAAGMSEDVMRTTWAATMGAAKDRVVYVSNSRHFVMDDQPAALDEAVAAFVAKHADAQPAGSQPAESK